MKPQTVVGRIGPAALLAAVTMLVGGCVEEHDVYVHREPAPVIVQTPPPEPVEIPAPAPPEIVVAPAPPPAPIWTPRSGDDLEHMVAAIALYPDPLLAQVLPAATLPSEIVMADRYVREGGDLNLVDLQPWDQSVKALTRYPELLNMMDNNLAWTTDLGLAFVNQPGDVMDAVQRLRARAYALGNLQTCPQQVVYVENRVIVIVPAAPAVVYVPVYVPDVVYVQRPAVQVNVYVNFGPPHPVGVWLNHDCDWREHRLLVWHHDNPRPADWWARRPSEHRRDELQHATAWRPRPVTQLAQAGEGDRGWGATHRPAPSPSQPHPTPPPPQPGPVHSGAHLVPPSVQRPPAPAEPPVHSGAHLVPGSPSGAPESRSGNHPVTAGPGERSTPPSARPLPVTKEPTPEPVHSGAHPVTPPAEHRPVEAPSAPRPVSVAKDPNAAPPQSARPAPMPAKPISAPANNRPVVAAPVPPARPPQVIAQPRPSNGALTGIESARDTQKFSSRGQQSRESMAARRPATPPGQARENNPGQQKKNPNSR